MLTLTKLEKYFSTGSGYVHKALDGLSLNVEKGDFITIVGSNGAGKSTLFNAICGDFFVDRGRIALEGKDITYLPAHKRSRIIGRLFQDPLRGSAPNMTIEENLALAYTSGRIGPLRFPLTKKNRDLFREHLARFGMGLEDRVNVKVGTLSGGNQQKIVVARELDRGCRMLIAAQPTRGVDIASADYIQGRILAAAEQGCAVLLISSDLDELIKVSDRIMVLFRGQIMGFVDADNATREALGRMMLGEAH